MKKTKKVRLSRRKNIEKRQFRKPINEKVMKQPANWDGLAAGRGTFLHCMAGCSNTIIGRCAGESAT
jgi:hypothetical protein